MRSRNKLLAEGPRADAQWLAALEAQMESHGHALHAARSELVARLQTYLAQEEDSPFARPEVRLSGWDADEAPLAERLRQERRRDAAVGRALTGPHRVDLAVTHAAKGQAAALCSTGEQKALLLSILLAHARLVGEARGRPPILLLDEVAAHIDPVRRLALFERLARLGGQIWMTGTEPELFAGLERAVHLHVDQGRVSVRG